MTVKEKMTAPIASVGADVEQPLQNFKTNQSIADLPVKGNLQATNNAENTAKSANKKNPDDEVLVSGKHSNNFAPISSDTKENQLCNLDPDKLKECFEMTLEALEKALRFIENNDLEKYNRSDYVNYLIGYFVFHKEKISEQQKNNLIDWYNNVTFTNKSNTTRNKSCH